MKAKIKTPLYLFTVILMMFTHNHVMAKVYKCKAADGKIEYRQTRCPNDSEQNKMERLNYKAPKSAPGDNPVRKAQALDDKNQQKKQAAIHSARERDKDVERCKKYKDRLARYKRDGIMGVNLKTGKLALMKGEGAATAMKNAKDNVAIFCS